MCDWGRTHIAVERKHTEWRDHRTNLNVAPKGVPPLSSVPHEMHTAHPAREESAHRAPHFPASPPRAGPTAAAWGPGPGTREDFRVYFFFKIKSY